MFTGVAVSSMPTVKQFFSRQDFSIIASGSSLKSSLSHLLSSPARGKFPNDGHSFTAWGTRNSEPFKHHEELRMRDLEPIYGQHKVGKVPREEVSQIHLTQDISVTRESLEEVSSKPAASSRHFCNV